MEQPILINIYNNIHKFIEKSKLKPINDKQLENSEFYNTINTNQYLPIVAISNTYTEDELKIIKKNVEIYTYHNTDSLTSEEIIKKYNIELPMQKIVYILLLHNESEYDNKTANFKNLISMIKYPNCNIIVISKNVLSTHVNKQINLLSTRTKKIYSYTYNKFKFLIYNHTLCSPHTILTKEEEDYLINDLLKIKKSNLPKIKIDDVQVIWIGGEVGNVIRIDRDSEITGKSIYYRVVIDK